MYIYIYMCVFIICVCKVFEEPSKKMVVKLQRRGRTVPGEGGAQAQDRTLHIILGLS